ncbi:MAG: glycerol-3-phosphate acyltransferase, partial [Acidimicrobiia bacterium]
MSTAGEVLAGIVIGYLIGTFPSADLVTRVATRGGVNIREAGSGNPGGLNSMRVLGKGWGVLVIVLDAAKGALAGAIGLLVGDAACYAAGTAVIAGHVWPVWTRFRGGRGVASAGGSFAAAFPPFFVLGAAVAGMLALVTRNPGLTIRLICPVWVVAAAIWWVAGLSNWWGPEVGPGLLVYSVVGAGIVLSRFRSGVR